MRIKTGPIYPYIAGTVPTLPAVAAQAPVSPAKATLIPLSPLVRANKLHVISSAYASPSFSNEKLVDGLRSVTKLIAGHCGQKVALATSAVWLAVDGAATWQTWRDPDSSLTDRAIETGELTADACALLGGILGSENLDHAATAIHFAAVVGDHVHTGQITLSPSELAEFSAHPEAEDISNLLKLTEVLPKTGTGAEKLGIKS